MHSNWLEQNRKEESSREYDDHDNIIHRNQCTENTIRTSPENEEHDIPPSSSNVTIQRGKKITNCTNGCEDVGLKSTSKEENMVKAVVPVDKDVSINVRNVQQNKIETNFQKTLEKLRQKLNARSKKENSNEEMVVDTEQRKNELFGKEYKVLDEYASELETTDHEIIGDYKFSADDEYENTQGEETEIDHEEVIETTRSNNNNIPKKSHHDNLFDLFLNVKGSEETMINEEKDTSENGKGETDNFGVSVDHVPIRNNSKDILMTKDKKNPKDRLLTNEMKNPKDLVITKNMKTPKDVEETSDTKITKNVQIINDMRNRKDGLIPNDTEQ